MEVPESGWSQRGPCRERFPGRWGLMSGSWGTAFGGRCGGCGVPAGQLVRPHLVLVLGCQESRLRAVAPELSPSPSCSARHMVRAQGSLERCFSEPGWRVACRQGRLRKQLAGGPSRGDVDIRDQLQLAQGRQGSGRPLHICAHGSLLVSPSLLQHRPFHQVWKGPLWTYFLSLHHHPQFSP